MSKLRSMTETIKMLSTENVALREQNDALIAKRAPKGKYLSSVHAYQKHAFVKQCI